MGFFLFLTSCGGGGGGVPSFSLNVSLNGNGTVTSNPAGINCTTGNQGTCQKTFSQGTQVTLTATPDPGWQFSSWGGDADCTDGQVTMDASKTCTATFVPLFTLTVAINGNGTVTSNPAGINCTTGNQGTCQKTFSQGTQVTLTASPASGWQFSNWAGCDSVNGNQCTVTVNGSKNVTANFVSLFTLTVTKSGNGTVTSNPAGIDCGSDCSEAYLSGTIVTLTATPDAGWQFDSWSGDSDCTDGQVTMNASKTCTATFTQITHPVSVSINPPGAGTVTSNPPGINCPTTCQWNFAEGSTVTLTANANTGYLFDSWQGCDSVNGNQCTLTMNASKTCTATFVQITWAKTYGGGYADYATSIQQTSDGGYIVAGYTSSFGARWYDFWVLKLDASGDVVWQKTYGGNDDDWANSIQQTSDSGYIVAGGTWSFGAGNYDFWVLKLDASGDVVWEKTYGGGDWDDATSIQQTSDGGYIVAGVTSSFGAGGDAWVLKLDASGDVVWQKTYGGGYHDWANSIQQTSDGGYIVAGGTSSFGAGYDDVWVLKLNASGDVVWEKTYGGGDNDFARSIQQTSDSGYIVAGGTWSFGAGLTDFWVLKLDASGDVVWQKTYGGGGEDEARSIQQTSDGGYIVAGRTSSFGAGLWDFWVLKLDASGQVLWQKTYGGGSNDEAYSIQQTSDGGYIVAGLTKSFGAGGSVWVLKLDASGNVENCTPSNLVQTSNAIPASTSITPSTPSATPTTPSPTITSTGVAGQDSGATSVTQCTG